MPLSQMCPHLKGGGGGFMVSMELGPEDIS